MKKFTICALALAAGACNQPTPEQSATENNAAMVLAQMEAMANRSGSADSIDAMTAVDAAATPSAALGWVYTEQTDKMRGAKNRRAVVDAIEPINLASPYGTSTPTLNIRQDAKYGFDIFIHANGQFLCRVYNNDTISVKFDSGEIEDWACADSDGGGSEIVFVTDAKSFLSRLKKSKEVTVEAQMYEAGRQQMTFKVAGLEW
jgi:hypothetical protein